MPDGASTAGPAEVDKLAEWRLPRHSASVGKARSALRDRLRAWGIADDTTDTVTLLLSELVTNAVRHARAPKGREIGARLTLRGDTVRLEVSDASDALPAPHRPGEDDTAGRGLLLVCALADDWGVSPRIGVGKTVWAELTIKPGAPC
ncbi:ATP-binding protein [Streptomyces sp. O3]